MQTHVLFFLHFSHILAAQLILFWGGHWRKAYTYLLCSNSLEVSSEQLALASYAADQATLETDPFVKTTAEKHLIVDPLYLDDRAANVLTVHGANLLKQLIEARLIPNPPTREQFLDAVKREGGVLSSAWRSEHGIQKIKMYQPMQYFS